MQYDIVTLEEKTVVGIAARTNNTDPNAGAVIGGLWSRFYGEGIYAALPDKVSGKALGLYTDYAGGAQDDYTARVACEVAKAPEDTDYRVCKIPAGRYARFLVRGHVQHAVAAVWQEIWQMDLPRAFQCDFEEYQDGSLDQAEIHIYVGLA